MACARLFLPSHIIELMNFAARCEPWMESACSSRRAACPLRGMVASPGLRLGPFCAVLRAALLAVGDADRVHGAAHDVVADAGQILDAPTADQHDRVLLQVVADAGNIGRDLNAVG